MNQDALIRAGVDYNDALARFMGSTELYEKFLNKFPSDATFPSLREAMAAGDVQAAFAQAHTLKGLAGNLSFKDLTRLVVPLVEALRGEDLAAAQALFPALENEYIHLCGVIRSEAQSPT